MRDANGRSHRPAGMPGAGRFESEADDSDLDVEPTPEAVLPPEEPEPRHGWGDYLSTAALTTAVTAVGAGGAALLIGLLSLDPRLRK